VRQGDAVTFADMSHSRGLPFRIVAVLGLGQDSRFPGVHFTESFDLMALTDQAGNPVRRRADRDSRSDNRNVFLDLILGARSSLYLSYCSGEGKKAGRLPSHVLTDFIELIALALGKDGVGALRAAVPLTAESMRNFHTEGGRFWRSHCPQLYESVCAAKEAAADEAPFADAGPLIAPGQMPELIDWSDLAFFWKDPDKWTLVRHGVEQEYGAAPDQTLPVVPETSALPGWAWKSRIAGLFDSGIPADEVNDIMGRDPMNGAEGVREFFARRLLDWLEICRKAEVHTNKICFCVYCYNVQPGIQIDYKTGDSKYTGKVYNNAPSVSQNTPTSTSVSASNNKSYTYVLNKNTKKFHRPDCSSVKDMKEKNKEYSNESRDEIIAKGYSPCKKCNP
jgi:hypothetical protein